MSLGMWEMVALAVLALMIFGPDRLPDVARNVGKTIAAFKREAAGTLDELKRAADLDDLRGVADDLRSQSADLKKAASVTGPVASSARPRRLGEPAPFDPDAT